MATQDLVTTDEALSFLQKQEPSDAPELAKIISRASSWIEQMTERALMARTFTDLRLNLGTTPLLRVPAWPIDITQPITVKVGTVVQTVWTQESDGDPASFNVIVGSTDPFDERWGLRNHFYRVGGWSSTLPWNYPGPWGSWSLGMSQVGFLPPVGASPLTPYSLLLSYTGGYAEAPDDLKQACLYLVQKLWQDQTEQKTGVASISTPTGGSITLPEPAMPREIKMLLQPYARNLALAGMPSRPGASGLF
jgi:hypothetical protein